MGAGWLWIVLFVLFIAAAVSDYRHRAARRLARSLDPGLAADSRREVERAEHEYLTRLADEDACPEGLPALVAAQLIGAKLQSGARGGPRSNGARWLFGSGFAGISVELVFGGVRHFLGAAVT